MEGKKNKILVFVLITIIVLLGIYLGYYEIYLKKDLDNKNNENDRNTTTTTEIIAPKNQEQIEDENNKGLWQKNIQLNGNNFLIKYELIKSEIRSVVADDIKEYNYLTKLTVGNKEYTVDYKIIDIEDYIVKGQDGKDYLVLFINNDNGDFNTSIVPCLVIVYNNNGDELRIFESLNDAKIPGEGCTIVSSNSKSVIVRDNKIIVYDSVISYDDEKVVAKTIEYTINNSILSGIESQDSNASLSNCKS